MKKISLILSVIICTVFFAGSFPVECGVADAATNSTYVAIGDSITSGYGLENFNTNDAENKSSEQNFVNKLSKKLGTKAYNYGVEGIDSSLLLKAITKPESAEQKEEVAQIKKAGVITLSIGGNNAMWPFLDALSDKLGKNKDIFNANAQELQAAAIGVLIDGNAINKLKQEVIKGSERFTGVENKTGDFNTIVNTIKKLNPKAQIIVLTIYNPYKSILPEILNNAIISMNKAIIKGSESGKNYKVADVYSAFYRAESNSILANVNTGKSFDPHPTAEGHQVIYTVTAYAAKNNVPYNIKSSVTNGKLATIISKGELVIKITPAKNYKAPEIITLKVGNKASRKLIVKNGQASLPIASVKEDFEVVGSCSK